MISIIVAYNENRVIGNGNDIPWHLPEDWKHFKKTTKGHSVIMGRKTWESLPKRPLPDRVNYVISRNAIDHQSKWRNENVVFVDDLTKAIVDAILNKDEIFIIGGEEIYRRALEKNVVDCIIATEVKGEQPGDKFFPVLDKIWENCEVIDENEDFVIKKFTK